MEDILSSIKRIIAEEGDAPQRPRRTPSPRAVAAPLPAIDDEDDDEAEVLELSDPMPSRAAAAPVQPAPVESVPTRTAKIAAAPAPAREEVSPIVSDQAAQATRGALDSLSRMMVKPDAGSDGTLEGLVRDMLRPMLAQWIDANLPPMVEAMVAREIAKITGDGR